MHAVSQVLGLLTAWETTVSRAKERKHQQACEEVTARFDLSWKRYKKKKGKVKRHSDSDILS